MLDYGEDPTVPPNRLAAHRQGGRQMAAPPPPAPPPNPTGTGKSYYGGQDVDEQMAAADPAQIQAMLKSKLGMGGAAPSAPPPPPNPAGSYAGSELDSALNSANGTDIEAMMRAGLGMAPPKQSWERPTMEWAGPQMAAQAKPPLNSWEMPTMDWAGPQMQAHAAAAEKQPTGPAPWSAGYTATSPSHSTWAPPVPDGGIMSGGKGGSYGEVENGGAYGSPLMQQLSGYSASSPSHSAWTPPDEGVMAGRGGSYGDVQNGGAYDPGMSPVMAKLRAAMANGTVPPAPQDSQGSIDYHPLAAGMTPGAGLEGQGSGKGGIIGLIREALGGKPGEDPNWLPPPGAPGIIGLVRGAMQGEPPAQPAPPAPPAAPAEAAKPAAPAAPPAPNMIDVPGVGQRAEPERPLTTAPPLPPPPPLAPNNSVQFPAPPPGMAPGVWQQSQNNQIDKMLNGLGGRQGEGQGAPVFAPTWDQFLNKYRMAGGALTAPAREEAMQDWQHMLAGQQVNNQAGLGLGGLGVEGGKLGLEGQKLGLEGWKAQKTFDPRTMFAGVLPSLLQSGMTTDQIARFRKEFINGIGTPPGPMGQATPGALMPGAPNAPTPTGEKPPAGDDESDWKATKADLEQGKLKEFTNDIPGFLKAIQKEKGEGYLAQNLPKLMAFAKSQYPDPALKNFMGRGMVFDSPFGEKARGTPIIGGALGGHTADDLLRAKLRAAGY